MILSMVCTDTSQCSTFGELSDVLFTQILNLGCKYIAVVGDNYTNTDSIKSGERARRDRVQMQDIRNPTRLTPLPKQ